MYNERKKQNLREKRKKILFGLTGTGYFDMTAYAQYNEKNDERPYPKRRGFGKRLYDYSAN